MSRNFAQNVNGWSDVAGPEFTFLLYPASTAAIGTISSTTSTVSLRYSSKASVFSLHCWTTPERSA